MRENITTERERETKEGKNREKNFFKEKKEQLKDVNSVSNDRFPLIYTCIACLLKLPYATLTHALLCEH